MKILYDYQIFSLQKFGGISRYFYELMKHSDGLFEYDVSGIFSENEYIKQLKLYKRFPIKRHFRGKWRIINFLNYLNKLDSKKKIKKKNCSIIHPTYYDPYVLKTIKNEPLIINAHDIIPEKKSEYINKKNNTSVNKNDVLPLYKKEFFSGKQGYILFTGLRGGYKNFDIFIEAVAPLLICYDLRLICTGQPFNNDEIELLSQHKIEDRVISKFVSESELRDLYAKALIFVFPSLYEGFGIPILEAFASGCPAILSNSSCFPEIAEDAAVYFDPYSVEDMRQIIEKALLDSSLQSSLIKKGYERIKYFSWEKTAKQTYELYCKALSSSTSSINKIPLVLTVYDIIHELFPKCFPDKDKTALNKYIMMRNADKIIAISKNTKMDIIKLYPEIDESKIEVIYLGTSFNMKRRA